jgi:DNA polymerase-3 subunit alpha
LDGAIQVKPLAERVKELGMPACAMTDHGNMYGAVSFYSEMKKHDVKPIIGCEVYLAPASRFDKKDARKGEKPYNHMILLAKDREGYHNLVRLTSKAFKEGFYRKPRIDRELLSQFGGGLIGLSACLSGVPQQHLKDGKLDEAEHAAHEFQDILGKGNYFLEIQDHELADQQKINKDLIELSKKTGIPLVATNDAHYLFREDYEAHDVMLCIGTGKTVNETDRMRFGGPQWYVRTPEEMANIFSYIPDAVTRTLEVAEMCDLKLPLGENQLPVYPIPASESDLSIDDYFDKVVRQGFERRRETVWEPLHSRGELKHGFHEYQARVSREIEMIKRMGFPSYFLIVWDFIKFAKDREIPVGPGRGSAAGSLVAYCLEITDVDPIQYDLLFERFLNPDRVSMPDIDIDFCVHGRGEVINHVSQLYGRDSVCQIITFGTMASKAAIKDVGRALDMPYADVEKIAKLIPPPIRGRNVSITQALEMVPELKQAVERDAQTKKVIEIARRLEGCARHSSVHAAGVVISPKPLEELIPVAVNNKQEFTTQFEMSDLEKTGMLKMDFLGLTTLSIINQCRKTIKELHGRDIDWSKIPLNDPKSYDLFAQGRTEAVFQFESSGMQEICRKLRPKSIEDLSALNALYRPGPLDGGMVDDFIDRYHGKKPVEYITEEMEEILQNTYGILVYQEQIMQLAQRLGGYSLGEADLMRRAMGKKKREEMAVHEEKFIAGCVKNKIHKKKAKEIFRLMAQFADYGFNRSHSVAYAHVAYQTAYLKANYPEHFYAAVMTYTADDAAKIFKYASELRAQKIKMLPPDVNESGPGFTPVEGAIRYGLSAIKGIGQSAVGAMIEARSEQPFSSLFDFAERVGEKGAGKRVLESLVCAGAFDSLKPGDGGTLHSWRASLTATVDRALDGGSRQRRSRASGQADMFGGAGAGAEEIQQPLEHAAPWTHKELLDFEKAAVGFYVSGHPLEDFAEKIEQLNCRSIFELASAEPDARVRLAGVVSDFTVRNTKKGDRYAFFRLEDLSGAGVKCVLWPEALKTKGKDAANDSLLLVIGRLDGSSESSLTVVCDEATLLEKARIPMRHYASGAYATGRPNQRVLVIELPSEGDLGGICETLARTLQGHPGDCAVFFDLPLDADGFRVRMRPERTLTVSSDQRLQDELKAAGIKHRWEELSPAAHQQGRPDFGHLGSAQASTAIH